MDIGIENSLIYNYNYNFNKLIYNRFIAHLTYELPASNEASKEFIELVQ